MASPAMKDGYVAIANRLLEAIIEARVSERQLDIILTIIRLTYGWRRRSVQMTEFDLADLTGATSGDSKRAGGAFRADVAELLREHVIVRLDVPGKRGLFTWALHKNYTEWGRFSVAKARLDAKWGKKPVSTAADDDAVDEQVARNQATSRVSNWPESGPDEQDEWPESGPLHPEKWPDTGPVSGPVTGPLSGPIPGHFDAGSNEKSTTYDRLQPVTAIESHKAAAARPLSDDEKQTAYAIGLVTAANLAVTEKWGEQTRPFLPNGVTQQVAADCLAAGVPLELARSAIAEKVRTYHEAPYSMRLFAKVIAEAFEVDLQRRRDRYSSLPARGGQPSHVSRELTLQREEEQEKQLRIFERERAKAAAAWKADPKNADAFARISSTAAATFAEAIASNKAIGELGCEMEISLRCAAAAGFPDFDAWAASRAITRTPKAS